MTLYRSPTAFAIAPDEVQSLLRTALARAGEVIVGKDEALRLALACLVGGGHLLIEDVPGVGKTTLAQVLARVLGLAFQRVQFTSDMLPADVIGASIFDRDSGQFRFHPGPVFAQVVLADEINRATPKCQSALLEAMEEGQVTVEGQSHPLPRPFFVIATQNPVHQIGTFPLPESQLDRFLMRLTLGYPERGAERALLAGQDRRQVLAALTPVLEVKTLLSIQTTVEQVHVAEALLDYVQALLEHSRRSPRLALGLSPRGGLALLRAARAWALLDGRHYVVPEDVQAVLVPVTGHRLQGAGDWAGRPPEALAEELRRVGIP